ncbi:MAG TPA: hypothetical protein VKS20_09935 [Candidatus Acidoferrales bacterium]|nr:hypothetical protein [Candidatus Acidoferrales bacterium]
MRKVCITVLAVVALALTASAQSSSVSSSGQANLSAQKTQSAQQGSQAAASASAASSSSASANAGPASAGFSNGAAVNADLLTTIDARKCHPGQRVEAKTTKDVKEGKHVILRRGTRLIGHVTEAQAHTKAHAESAVGIVFDEAVIKKGETVPFHASIQALAAAQTMANAGFGDDDMMAGGGAGAMGGGAVGGGGGLVGGAAGAVGSTAGMAGGAAGNLGRTAGGSLQSTTSAADSATGSAGGNLRGLNAAGQLTSTSSGVFGMNGLNLSSSASNATEGSVITSANRNVHLSSGTQMLLRTNSQLGHDADQQGHGASHGQSGHPAPSHTPNRAEKQ